MKKALIKYSILFFIPVIGIYILLEALVLSMPANYKNSSDYYNENKNSIEIIALGSSQMAGAINPEYFNKPAICLASSSQHHKLDFTIFKQLQLESKKTKYVIIELSPNHLNLPHNTKSFWKNSVYLKYFNVNAFERETYFKDELIYISNPDLYSKKMMEYYLLKTDNTKLNKYGYNLNVSESIFKKYDFDEIEISKLKTNSNQLENPEIFKHNTAYLFSMLNYYKENNIHPIICTLPLYKTYRNNLNANIVNRRDSIISVIKNKYPEVTFFEAEKDTATFKIYDYSNANHLNPDGAKKFTLKLNEIINKIE